jgi:ABC-2 type transport system ATP-binding protein
LGCTPQQPEQLFRLVGYCTQFDSFPKGLTGHQLIYGFLRVHGKGHAEAENLTWKALEQVRLTDAAHRKIAAYSKGMRQRIKLGFAISHQPAVLVLDEPLNGLDPMARAESIALFQELAHSGLHVIISSHILHEVDILSDQVILLDNGYVVAEGDIRSVRGEVKEHPIQVLIRCDRPAVVASRIFEQDHVVEVKINPDDGGLFVRTRDAESFYLLLNRVILENGLKVETVAPADEDIQSVYGYLIGHEGSES